MAPKLEGNGLYLNMVTDGPSKCAPPARAAYARADAAAPLARRTSLHPMTAARPIFRSSSHSAPVAG